MDEEIDHLDQPLPELVMANLMKEGLDALQVVFDGVEGVERTALSEERTELLLETLGFGQAQAFNLEEDGDFEGMKALSASVR